MDFLTEVIDFFLPRFCSSCKTKLSLNEEIVCESCFSKIKHADQERLNCEFERKFNSAKIISGFTSLFIFEKDKELQHIIHGLKYDGKFRIGIFLGKLLANELKNKFSEWNIDFIVPVPLHHLKKAERGYNQSEFLAKGMRSVLKISVENKLIKRNRFTETQTNLTLPERKENIYNAFTMKNRNIVKQKNILLLDDVITTGATIAECGNTLLESGAANVYATSVAIAD
ncbi:MAG: ComF family protein [Ignavibacteriales bacterium]|nr:ComF family protein [Ignavibacteriales bacterium]